MQDLKNLDQAILWFRKTPMVKAYKYRNAAGNIRYKIVYSIAHGDKEKYYELARGNAIWEALLKAYDKLYNNFNWSISVPKLRDTSDVLILDPGLKKKAAIKRRVLI